MSVLLEVMTILRAYEESLVLIGGWVPYLLLRGNPASFEHAGSIDIDLAVDISKIGSDAYATIVQRLADRGYTLDPTIKYRLNRTIPELGAPIGIDFLVEHAPDQGKNRRHRTVQPDLEARATQHLDMAFKYPAVIRIEGELPGGGGKTSLEIQMADIPAFFALKGLALGERYKEKDAYDIYAVTRYYGKDIQEVAGKLAPHQSEPGLKEGMANIREKFRSLEAAGPAWVVNFISPASGDNEIARLRQDAFITMDTLLNLTESSGI